MSTLRRLATAMVTVLALGLPLEAMPAATRLVGLQMAVYLAGLKVGTLRVDIDYSDQDALTRFELESSGLAAMLTGYRGWSEARTSLPADAAPRPLAYDAFYQTNRYNRKVQVRYDPADGRILDLKSWKRGKPQQSKVPQALRAETVDPLTALLMIRHWLEAARAGGPIETTLEVFDGGRRYSLKIEILDRGTAERGGREIPIYRLKMQMTPLAGFSKRDMLANWASEDAERWIEVLITDDDEPVPLSIRTHGGTLASTVKLEQRCLGGENCVSFGS